MKNLATLKAIISIIGWLVVSMPTAAFAGFSTADLSGTWHIFTFADLTSANDPDAARGTLTINANGTVAGGSFIDSSGANVNATGGTLSLNSKGILSGTVTLSTGTLTISEGKLDRGKNMLTFVGSDSGTSRIFGNGIKAGGTFATADLAGIWHVFTFNDHPSSNDPSWTRGTISVNSSGTLTGGSLTDDTGAVAAVTGGSLSLDGSGVLTGSVTLSAGITVTVIISQGKANAGKTIAPLVGFDSQGYFFQGVAIKAVGAFSTADLGGTWHYFSFWDSGSGNDPGWDRGIVTMSSRRSLPG